MKVLWMRCRTHSIHELFLLIIIVAVISVVITYQVSKYLLHRNTEVKIHFDGRVDIYGNFETKESFDGRNGHARHDDKHIRYMEGVANVLEGMQFKVNENQESWKRPKIPVQKMAKQEPRSPLEHALYEMEDEWFANLSKLEPEVAVCGDRRVIDAEYEIYYSALSNYGFILQPPIWNSLNASMDIDCSQVASKSALLVLCLVNSSAQHEELCNILHSSPYQQLNHIPGVQQKLWRKDGFCETVKTSSHIPVVKHGKLFPPCFLLPSQYEEYLVLADVLGTAAKWVFKPSQPGGRTQLLQPTLGRDYFKIKELSVQDVVIQQYVENPLLLFGMPFSVTSYVLLTSMTPLHAYIHSEGVVHHRHDYQGNFKKISGRTWSLDQLQNHITHSHGLAASHALFHNMATVITQTLLIAERAVTQHWESYQRHSSYYELLGFEIIFNSSFHAIIMEVSGSTDLSEISQPGHLPNFETKNPIIEDTIELLLSRSYVATDLARALEGISDHVGVQNVHCQSYHKLCLTRRDLYHLLTSRRQDIHRGRFSQLYPSNEANNYTPYVDNLKKYLYRNHSTAYGYHTTIDLHSVLASLAHYYHILDSVANNYDELNIPQFQEIHKGLDGDRDLHLQNIGSNEMYIKQRYVRQHCSEEPNTMPLMESFHSDPPVNVTPAFDPEILEYYAEVSHNVLLLTVWAYALSCNCEARMEDKHGLSRPANYTLGLGNNRISILIVDVTHTEPWILATYTLTVYRSSPDEKLGIFKPRHPHTICSLQQDCDLKIVPYMSCGLENSEYQSWNQYRKYSSLLPSCKTGDASGLWLVPCINCSSADLCYWKMATWQPHTCTHPRLHRDVLKQCLTGKKVMFIGDSTNRGMMHYMMEAVNDSLTEWDKTHNIRVYSNLNLQKTKISFAYYPQFWLPVNQRPVFGKALLQLIQESQPLENTKNTVLVVGGVHWLATHHLTTVAETLKRQGLSHINVIMKGLGAGFHQAVDGLHCLSQAEQRKLLIHSKGLNAFAHAQGFHVVDTFNMTMARYKHFLQGQCACHFHRVRETLPSFSQFLQSTGGAADGSKLIDMPIHYHVEGDINKAYSEMLFNRICE